MASILNLRTGEFITQGLQSRKICDEAIQMARRIAAERGENVLLDDDGLYIVYPNGLCEIAVTDY